MSTLRPSRSVPPPLPDADAAGPLDHALTLLLADDPEAALRWGAAALERTPSSASAVIVTARLLERMGRLRAAIDGLRLAALQAIEEQNLPLAVVAIEDLRHLGADVASELDEVAGAFCRESPRLDAGTAPMPFASLGDFQPLSPFLSGPALASRATQILKVSKYTHDELAGASPFAPVPLFSALSKEALRDLLPAFQMITVPAGRRVVEEGQNVDAAYVVARGELEISRRADAKHEGLATSLGRVSKAPPRDNKPPIVLSRIGRGAFFGEIATVSRLAAPSTVTATRPSILLVAKREVLEAVAVQHPEVAAELARHCRHHMIANLGWTSPLVAAMPPVERAALVDRLEMRFFRRGERLVERGDDAKGLHLIVSGEVAVVGRDGREGVALGSLGPGETVGEGELVLCRRANTDATAVRDTATLWLSRDDFFALVEEHQSILHGLYAIAVRRFNDTEQALQAGSEVAADVSMIDPDDDAHGPPTSPSPGRHLPAVASTTVPWSSGVNTPLGPPVAPLPVAPTFFVHDNPPQPSPESRRPPLAPQSLLPPSSQPLHGSRSAWFAPRTTTTPPPRRPSDTPPRSVAPTTATLPPRTASRRPPAAKNGQALKTFKAIGLAAVAAGIVAAALVASRDTQTGLGAAAAAVGAEPASPAIADDAPERDKQLEEAPVAPAPPPAVAQHTRPVEEPRTIAAPSTLAASPDKASPRKAVTTAMAHAAASAESGASTPSTTASAVSDAAPVASTVAGAAEPSADDAFGGRR